MRVLLDTNRYVDLCRGDPDLQDQLSRVERICLPFIALGELRAGFGAGKRTQANERVLQRFLATPGVELLLASEATTHHYAALWLQLRRQGTPIPTNDLWLAALCVEHRLQLLSRDRHFDHLPQVDRVG